MKIDGVKTLMDTCNELDINLTQLIAHITIWANPIAVNILREDNNPNALWIRNCRRNKRGEKRRIYANDGCYLDDNTFANISIKMATGQVTKQDTFTACHIYKDSCYNSEYHTSIPNLVLIPKGIHSLADYDENVVAALKYKSYMLYGFYIDSIPHKPEDYDSIIWRNTIEFSEKIRKSITARKRKAFVNDSVISL